MFLIDLKSRKPIYEQIVDNFRRLITTGALQPGERVPSVRDMAKTVMCNPNTMQKAFRELETLGYFYTVPGQGSFVSEPTADSGGAKAETLLREMESLVRELEYIGLSRQSVAAKIEKGDYSI